MEAVYQTAATISSCAQAFASFKTGAFRSDGRLGSLLLDEGNEI
jgi:hypothetical protein